ncbi:hypothetical protein VTK73DRAFT_7325 [Phialemonium thermophilum]|uniref:Adhesin domain-containing protein n=1 Tax=Phialemonium thermophilum TaxID=223376 RepID=A0ABR3XTL2_9PEZI
MPYSDNLYSALENDVDLESAGSQWRSNVRGGEGQDWDETNEDPNQEALVPADGYFHGASSDEGQPTTSASYSVPYVPNVWVRDPTVEQLSAADGKAREAEEEQVENNYSPLAVSDDARLGRSGPRDSSGTPNHLRPSEAEATPAWTRAAQYHSSSSTHIPPATWPYTPRTSQTSVHDNASPLLPQEAPPAYTPSTSTSPQSAAVFPYSPRNYNTFPQLEMGREETRPLISGGPESMGPADGLSSDDSPPWRERARRRLCLRSCWVSFLGLLVVAVTLTFLISGIDSIKHKDQSPEQQPPFQKEPTIGDPDIDLPWPSDPVCGTGKVIRTTASFDLSFGKGHDLSVVQDIERDGPSNGRSVRVSGEVIIRRSKEGTPNPSVVVDVLRNNPNVHPRIWLASEEQILTVTVPRGVPWAESSTWPCLRIHITIYIPEDGSLENLAVSTVHLGIHLLSDLSLRIAKQSQLSSVSGSIFAATDAPKKDENPPSFIFENRWIDVRSVSGEIHGHWPLYDYLGLQTTSGDIGVKVWPKEVNHDDPKPAILFIRSVSGDVNIRSPVDQSSNWVSGFESPASFVGEQIPPRDYRVDVQTTSGDIKGAVAFSSDSRFHSKSGQVYVGLLPVLDPSLADKSTDNYASVESHSLSGDSRITVYSPLWVDTLRNKYFSSAGRHSPQQEAVIRRALRSLKGRHSSTSGDINLVYPEVWEGDISLSSLSGRLGVSGKDVRRIREGGKWPGVGKEILARKGPEGGSYVELRSTSGDIYAKVE